MYNVGNNLLPPPAAFGGGALPGIGVPGSGFGSAAAMADAIDPALQPPAQANGSAAAFFGSGNGPGGFIAQFMSTFFGAMSQMAQYFTSMSGTPPWAQGQPALASGGASPQPVPTGGSGQGARPEQFFTSADLSSNGDPHDRFEGTLADGGTIGGKWNNMANHPHLLESNSFQGGFEVSTDVSDRNGKGITHNDSASIETNYGRNVVTMNADGSYSVTKDGTAVALQTGKAVDLGNGETVTLNADKSLTVLDKNAAGGSVTTTLQSNGTAVNVDASAQNVDLGGYLARHAAKLQDATPPGNASSGALQGESAAQVPLAGNMLAPPPGTQYETYQPYQPYNGAASEPLVAGSLQQFEALT
jgi:hypothetical protein